MAARNRALPWQWFDSTGSVLAGGKIYFYSPGTTNDKTTWKDSGKSTEQANPIVLDSAGRFDTIPYTEGLYDVKIDDSNDNNIDTWSNWGEEETSATDLSTITMTAGTGLSGGGTIDSNRTFNVDYASQAQQEAGTATGVAVNPAVQHHHDSAAKFWANFSNGGVIGDSYNVASVDDDGTGDFGVNIDTDFSGTNFTVSVTPLKTGTSDNNALATKVQSVTAGAAELLFNRINTNAQADPDRVFVAGHGDQ